jgi:hypothetical protein
MALGFNLSGRPVRVGLSWATLLTAMGLAGLLFHAAFDRDVQWRRLYMTFAYAALVVGAFLCVFPTSNNTWGASFRYGIPCLVLALVFFLAFLRNEHEPFVRNVSELTLGGAGALMVLIGLFGGTIKGEFLLPIGLVLSLLGLIYLAGFVGTRGLSDDLAYYAGLAVGGVGLLAILVATIRSFVTDDYFMQYGQALILVGLIFGLAGIGLCSDRPLVVLTRRELGTFFFSPIAYLVLFGFAVVSWIAYNQFLDLLTERPNEPVVAYYLFNLFPVFMIIFVVPVLTMRLLSEELRSGTMEVLMTAPVEDWQVVVSKFLAGFLTFMVVWIPFGLFLLAIPLSGGNPFDYRPLFSFLIALVLTGAGFISMGLFFSSLTKNQMASGVLTFAGMLVLTGTYFVARTSPEGGGFRTVLMHVSFLDLWRDSLTGKLLPRNLLFYPAMTIFFLFLTMKVLESRKWR